ncbi:MAG: neuraminidase-like domain-containing protein [Candidatus Sulfotelmatobacter sp.]
MLIANPTLCSRVAYDIVWSYQNMLPAPPDALESLYTNPPNPGGSADNSNSSTNNLEQDRQKFEGTLNSFYSKRNAIAERLTKFVAAVSAAVVCEQASLNSSAALLEFPVDPSSTFATAVESELLLQGVEVGGSGSSAGSGGTDANFGVPAAYFYALAANLDKSTTAIRRFQQAVGDDIERLLQQFSAAQIAKLLKDGDSENFVTPPFTSNSITSFQATRRLAALKISTASTSPTVTLFAGTPLAKLVQDWLKAPDPTPTPAPNPPLTYQNTDFNIWTQQLAPTDQQGYLYLDLYALTKGYVIPSFNAPAIGSTATTLTFAALNSDGTQIGIGVGMPVSGTNIAPGTTVTGVAPAGANVTVNLSTPTLGAVTGKVTFNEFGPTFTATTTKDCPAGTVLTFAGPGATNGIQQGMTVFGPNIPAGTTVSSVAAPTINLNNPVSGDIPAGTVIEFATFPPPSLLGDQIANWLTSKTVQALKNVTATQWTDFFTNVGNPTWLPPLTQPVAPGSAPTSTTQKAGYIAMRIRAFIRAVQLFFSVSSVPTQAKLPEPDAPPTFDLPSFDAIALAVAELLTLHPGFTFDTPITPSDLATTVANVFPTDLAAQAWLADALTSISELWQVASVVQNPAISGGYTLPNKVSFAFSVAEALYARGFRKASDISNISQADFQQALTGTVAYDFALSNSGGLLSLYQQAQKISPPTTSPGSTSGPFQPINPDGSLVDCVPPPCLSPLGPINYLKEMLQLSQASTCENPWAPPASDSQMTLGNAVAARRGPVGSLLADCANLETPLPVIDIVNECLEYLGATQPSTMNQAPSGTVYNTSTDELAGYELCEEDDCSKERDRDCHKPPEIFAALPEYSTPATPVTGENDSVEPLVYNDLRNDFSSCCLPYPQALDVSRTYLKHLGSCRFEELRTFRKCITEFALDPDNPPTGFQSFLWRYPVRIDIAIEYLGITPEEYTMLFQGAPVQSCGSQDNPNGDTAKGAQNSSVPVAQLYGFSSEDDSWMEEVVVLSEFLKRTCLTYCEFLELSKVWSAQESTNGNDGPVRRGTAYPECEPCCLKDYRLQISEGTDIESELFHLAVFIRLWRKLREVCGARYTFQQLYDICTVLKFFSGTVVNPDFIRQLAAFQMLRDHFKLPLIDHRDASANATGANRTHLLALWVGNGAKKWKWAVHQLLEGVEEHARTRFGCERRSDEHLDHMADNLDALSRLAGFNPPTSTNPSTDTWNSTPACTLRFAEVLAKMCASKFRIGELLYLFNAVPPHEHEDPFEQDAEDALNYPLDLPEEGHEHSLWKLREALLEVEVCEEEIHHWTWPRMVARFREKFGYAPSSGQDPLLSLGQHFFPDMLEDSGYSVSDQQRQYRISLASTAPWNTPAGGPFQYGSSQLWTQLPLRDEAVASQLGQLPTLNNAEQVAVQDLYFAPRLDLAPFAFLFPDWQSAEKRLIQEHEQHERWAYFRRHFALADARRKVIAKHLAKHVSHHSGCNLEAVEATAGLALSQLLSDENNGTPWEADSGVPPAVMWSPQPYGGAIAALLGLTGTGLLGEYLTPQTDGEGNPVTPSSGGAVTYTDIWREVRGPLEAFGHERDHTNSPVPTVLPALGLTPAPSSLVTFRNGYAIKNSDGEKLGGAEPIHVRWSGVLLVEHEGEYRFRAGAPAPEEEEPSVELAEKSQWRITLTRGSKSWLVLNHQWPGESGSERCAPHLRRGAYSIVIEYNQPAPNFAGPHVHRQHTGFQVKYAGPDTHECLTTLPLKRLYRDLQDQTLDQGITFLPGSKNAQAFLKALYTSTLRDMRRTYQRAFKAVLFAGRFELSAWREEDDQSELGYMLANSDLFAGYAYYRTSPTAFTQHLADFDFNFLPLQDNYHPPTATPGDRSDPSLQRTQALFDCWERIFDYDRMRKEVHRAHKGHVWELFEEAQEDHPTNPAGLLRYIDASSRERAAELRFFQDQTNPIYSVTSANLEDERWLIRVWNANQWLNNVQHRFHAKDISKARPDLWASSDPSAPLPASGTTETGNANLLAFIADGCIENGEPRHYLELKRLNDGLRDRGRRALICYLCNMNRVARPWGSATFAITARDLSDLLLLDVETGLCEKASRIEEAISAVQTFVRRSRIGLEPQWKTGRAFARLWDGRFENFRTWQRCKRREFYKENFIEWDEFGKARRIEAFRFLESQLRASTLTLAAPGGLDYWADDAKNLEHEPELIQRVVPSELHALTAPPDSTTREGLGTLGNPEYADQTTWLAAVPQSSSNSGNQSGNNGPSSTGGPNAPGPNTPGSNTPVPNTSALVKSNAQSLVRAAATGSTQPQVLPFWMEAAMKLGTRFVRVAAAGVPEAALSFEPHRDEPKSSCCRECGCDHPVLVDEYYFWLVDCEIYTYTDETDEQSNPSVNFTGSYQFGFQDSYYDLYQQQSGEWNDEDQVPSLLAKWEPNPAVRLAWCRVHNGGFGQPRKSEGYVAISDPADLVFLGRSGDSLYFQVSGSADLPPGFGGTNGDTSPPGFRYDLPSDEAVALPQALKPPAPVTPSPYPPPLLSYPFFAYFEPGARLFPASWFAPSLLVGNALRAHCHYELALKWYQRAFNPLEQDCAWMHCSDQGRGPTNDEIAKEAYQIWQQHGRPETEQTLDWNEAKAMLKSHETTGGSTDQTQQGACCDSTKVSKDDTRNRAITLQWCQTVMDWGDAIMRHRRSPEGFEQARTLYDAVGRITGTRPRVVRMTEPTSVQSVSSFTPAYPALNPRLMDLYDHLDDRHELIHNCMDARRLRNGRLNEDMCYFGEDPLRHGWRTVPEGCAEEGEWCWRHSPYRFVSQISKAIELAAKVREFGNALLSAYEKGDAEILASIRAEQEREMQVLNLAIRQDQWRDADWQIQALQQSKEADQTNLLYYTNLYQNGLINNEIQNLSLSTNAMQTRTGANITEAIGEALKVIPDFYVGAMSTFSQVPIGTKLAGLFETIAKIMLTVAEIQSATAAIDMTQASWQRRSDEWFHQMQVLPVEIQQKETLILGAHRKRDQSMHDLNNEQRLIEHSAEVLDFLRDKFTATDLYLFLQQETLGLQRKMYELAHHAAIEAQRAFNFERGHTTRHFIPEEIWDDRRRGLMAGERLESALRHMEKAYLDENVREYELTKHFSLRLHFPKEFLRLKITGCCDIEIPEWMFDMDYPGHYMRRIKNMSLTIPCVTGPYTGVHCRVTLLSSMTRIDPRLEPPSSGCCECERGEGYEACLHDPRVVRMYGAKEAIATSSGQNDSGLFELSFRDERYLPFEFHGAVCRVRIEIPPENNFFPMESLTDMVLHMNHTSREGGELLRRAASRSAQKHLPGSGWCYFDVRHEFPDAWELLQNSCDDKDRRGKLSLWLHRKMFPYVPAAGDIFVARMAILFHSDDDGCGRWKTTDCPCPHEGEAARRVIGFRHGRHHDDDGELHIACLTTEEAPELYYGAVDTNVGPLGRDHQKTEVQFRFPEKIGELERVYLLCRYERWQEPC